MPLKNAAVRMFVMKLRQEIRIENSMFIVSLGILCILFFATNARYPLVQTETIERLMQTAILGILLAALLYVAFCKEADRGAVLIFTVMLLGIVMRIGYALYTPITERSHDLNTISLQDTGHAAYIMHILEGGLPKSNAWQFNHPPLFHILAAATVKIYALVSQLTSIELLMQAAKIVPCAASIISLLLARKICRVLQLGKPATLFTMSLAAFQPTFYLLSGSVNNDSLLYLFMSAIIYYTILWRESPTMRTTILLALSYGLGMMTKMSCGLLAPLTAIVMLHRWLGAQKGRRMEIFNRLLVFAAIALPLGLWYPIRNYILFAQPLNYVAQIGEDSPLYTGMKTIQERLCWNGSLSLITPSFCNIFEDYNIWYVLARSALFGEYIFLNVGEMIPKLFLVCNLGIMAISLACAVFVLVKQMRDPNIWLLVGTWLLLIASYILFYVQYPFSCTMDFRYIVPTVLIGAIMIGKASDLCAKMKWVQVTMACMCIAFSTFSIVMYCNI